MTNESNCPFQTLESQKTHIGRFTVVQDRVRVNDCEQPYDYLEIKEGVCVLPIYREQVLLQKQYRYPIRAWQWELPGGFIDPGETPQEAAIRELKEETGYPALKIHSLGAFYPSFGSTDEKIHLFLAQCGEPGSPDREPGEALSVCKISLFDFQEMVRAGTFMHGAGLAAWCRCAHRLPV